MFTLFISRRINALQQSENYFKSIGELIYEFFCQPVIIVDFLLIPYVTYPPDAVNTICQNRIKKLLLQHMADKTDDLFVLAAEDDADLLVIQKIKLKEIMAGYIVIPVPEPSTPRISEKKTILLSYAANALASYLSNFHKWNSETLERDYSLYSRLLQNDTVADDIVNYWITR